MISKMSRNFLLIGIFIIQIITIVKSQYSVNPITSNNPNPNNQPISLTYRRIQVGYNDDAGKTGFSMNNFTANIGESLFFDWVGDGTHSVVQGTTDNPCVAKQGGFNFGIHKMPYNNSILVNDLNAIVFFSDVADDCTKGMYGGVNLPAGYNWPANLATPPKQIVKTPLNDPTSTPTPTGSMSIAAASAENTQGSSSSDSLSTSYYLKGSSFGIIIGSLMLISFYF